MLSFPHAKINLGLQITRKRPDGFHDLETCFFPVPEVFDALEMCPSKESSLEIFGMDWNEAPEANLVWKAMELFRKEEASLPPLSWFIQKKIPFAIVTEEYNRNSRIIFTLFHMICRFRSIL